MSFGEWKRERVKMRKRSAFADKSTHPKAISGTQIEERKYSSVSRPYYTDSGQTVHL
jgi:hypothetical protein